MFQRNDLGHVNRAKLATAVAKLMGTFFQVMSGICLAWAVAR